MLLVGTDMVEEALEVGESKASNADRLDGFGVTGFGSAYFFSRACSGLLSSFLLCNSFFIPFRCMNLRCSLSLVLLVVGGTDGGRMVECLFRVCSSCY